MANYVIDATKPLTRIHREIYGHFSEHLGRGIYQGIFVGEDSAIPNEKVPEDIYERRLSVCRECAFLNAATCMLCGCYVELRAAFRNAACPHVPGLWKAERVPARRKKVK